MPEKENSSIFEPEYSGTVVSFSRFFYFLPENNPATTITKELGMG
jgi:hypothetical protein